MELGGFLGTCLVLLIVLIIRLAEAQPCLNERDQNFLFAVDDLVEAGRGCSPPLCDKDIIEKAYNDCYHLAPARLENESEEDFDQRELARLGDLDPFLYLVRLESFMKRHEDFGVFLHGNGDQMLITKNEFPAIGHMDFWAPEQEGAISPFAKFPWLAIQTPEHKEPTEVATMRVSAHVKSDLGDEERTKALWGVVKIAFQSGATKLKMVVPSHRRTDTIVISFPVENKNETQRRAILSGFETNLIKDGVATYLEGGNMLPPFQYRTNRDLVCAADYDNGDSFGIRLCTFMVTESGNPNRIRKWRAQNQPVGNNWNFGVANDSYDYWQTLSQAVFKLLNTIFNA